MMSKINSFFRSLYDTESKNGKKLREISMMIMRLGMWMITYGSFSVLFGGFFGNDSNLLIVFYVQIMPDDLVMQLHRF